MCGGRPINMSMGSVSSDPLPASVLIKPAIMPAPIINTYLYHSRSKKWVME
jgi:hypothetical protein